VVLRSPELVLRLLVLVYPRSAERRRELLGELGAMRRLERPLWVAEQIETALFDGLRERVRMTFALLPQPLLLKQSPGVADPELALPWVQRALRRRWGL
jgi:hypothetical protein